MLTVKLITLHVPWAIQELDVFNFHLNAKLSLLKLLVIWKLMVNHVDGMDLNVLIKLAQLPLRHSLQLHNAQDTYQLVLLTILWQLMVLWQFKDVKIYQQHAQQENHQKIVKSQELDSQHVYGFHLLLHVLKNHVPLLVQWEQQVHFLQEDLLFLVVKLI